ncbi:MAG: O-antigen ligase family protein [Candidatus Wildermuthbacteria bacterium]|nr:O-antigen ligase family protein [Candidatus Wildermuthbacteria bacterium]
MAEQRIFLLEKVLLAGIALILFIPLLSMPPWFSPPAWGQAMVFRVVIGFLIALFAFEAVRRDSHVFSYICHRIIQIKWAFFLFALLFLLFFLSTLLSVDPSFSFWGDPGRAGGFLQLFLFFLFCILAFLAIKDRSWPALWTIAISAGIGISLVAIFQQFRLLNQIFIFAETRPPSTVGGAIFLGTYMVLLIFLALAFFFHSQSKPRKIFFLSASILFCIIILLSGSRSAYIAFAVGIFYFLLFLPLPQRQTRILNPSTLRAAKIVLSLILIGGSIAIYYFNTHPDIFVKNRFLSERPNLQIMVQGLASRFSAQLLFDDPRTSAWLIGLQALKERPLLGYGPENFAVGFDQFFDPALPNFETKDLSSPTNWWDRAHNIFLDIGVAAGIPALLTFLALLGFLFWKLYSLKKIIPQDALLIHGTQTTLLAYLVVNIFSFDTFSTYLLLFFLVAYAFFLLRKAKESTSLSTQSYLLTWKIIQSPRTLLFVLLFALLAFFTWKTAVQPIQLTTQINLAQHDVETKKCEQAVLRMERAQNFDQTFLAAYFNTEFAEILKKCGNQIPERKIPFTQKARGLLAEAIKSHPVHTGSWLFYGGLTNTIIEAAIINALPQEQIAPLIQEADAAFRKAHELSPKRQKVLIEWMKTDILAQEYADAKERASQCIELNLETGACWWFKGLAEIYLGDLPQAQNDIKIANQKEYPIRSLGSLQTLANAYITTKNYPLLMTAYQQMLERDPKNAQYHASLAIVFKELRKFDDARQHALMVLELNPATKSEVETFLKELPTTH